MDSSVVNKWNWAFLFKLIARGFGQFGATNKAEQTERQSRWVHTNLIW